MAIAVDSKRLAFGPVIARGRNGTMFYRGTFDGRPVAIKRLWKDYHDFARRDKEKLSELGHHPNIIRMVGYEEDEHFIHHVLEPIDCTLLDFFNNHREFPLYHNGYPSSKLLGLIRGIVDGLEHLHSLGFVLPGLKPSDVLMVNQSPKLSVLGTCIPYAKDHSLSANDTSDTERTLAMDMPSLGIVIYYCLVQDKRRRYSPHELVYEAFDLLGKLFEYDLEFRPKALEVLLHPLFWNSMTRLSFMRDASEWMEKQDNASLNLLLEELEDISDLALPDTMWQTKVRTDFLSELERVRCRECKTGSEIETVESVLCIVRDTMNSYDTLPVENQVLLGSFPEGVDHYFREMFPKLLMLLYDCMYHHCKQEEWFGKYMNRVFLYG